jgi:hypothetical protein
MQKIKSIAENIITKYKFVEKYNVNYYIPNNKTIEIKFNDCNMKSWLCSYLQIIFTIFEK